MKHPRTCHFNSIKLPSLNTPSPPARAILECNKASSSYPAADIQWTKDGNSISESDIFMNSKRGEDEFGYLYILNVKEDHAGKETVAADTN